eukprot:TRINITY_DN44100_c0_g1_i1.p1 TRINITY_DN44100_c0_g1~~TRINITY_DN44100_c0_g1_i1.p1  ORF type:complete len:860 (+),score=79.35 TRINITY_DN44100_c0_g1_i1:90-2669(+)
MVLLRELARWQRRVYICCAARTVLCARFDDGIQPEANVTPEAAAYEPQSNSSEQWSLLASNTTSASSSDGADKDGIPKQSIHGKIIIMQPNLTGTVRKWEKDACEMLELQGKHAGDVVGCIDVADLVCAGEPKNCLQEKNDCYVGRLQLPPGVGASVYNVKSKPWHQVCGADQKLLAKVASEDGGETVLWDKGEKPVDERACSFKFEALPHWRCKPEKQASSLAVSAGHVTHHHKRKSNEPRKASENELLALASSSNASRQAKRVIRVAPHVGRFESLNEQRVLHPPEHPHAHQIVPRRNDEEGHETVDQPAILNVRDRGPREGSSEDIEEFSVLRKSPHPVDDIGWTRDLREEDEVFSGHQRMSPNFDDNDELRENNVFPERDVGRARQPRDEHQWPDGVHRRAPHAQHDVAGEDSAWTSQHTERTVLSQPSRSREVEDRHREVDESATDYRFGRLGDTPHDMMMRGVGPYQNRRVTQGDGGPPQEDVESFQGHRESSRGHHEFPNGRRERLDAEGEAYQSHQEFSQGQPSQHEEGRTYHGRHESSHYDSSRGHPDRQDESYRDHLYGETGTYRGMGEFSDVQRGPPHGDVASVYPDFYAGNHELSREEMRNYPVQRENWNEETGLHHGHRESSQEIHESPHEDTVAYQAHNTARQEMYEPSRSDEAYQMHHEFPSEEAGPYRARAQDPTHTVEETGFRHRRPGVEAGGQGHHRTSITDGFRRQAMRPHEVHYEPSHDEDPSFHQPNDMLPHQPLRSSLELGGEVTTNSGYTMQVGETSPPHPDRIDGVHHAVYPTEPSQTLHHSEIPVLTQQDAQVSHHAGIPPLDDQDGVDASFYTSPRKNEKGAFVQPGTFRKSV